MIRSRYQDNVFFFPIILQDYPGTSMLVRSSRSILVAVLIFLNKELYSYSLQSK